MIARGSSESQNFHVISCKTQLIGKIKKYTFNNSMIIAVYLFGSYGTGKAKKNSDIDLGILFKDDFKGLDRIERLI